VRGPGRIIQTVAIDRDGVGEIVISYRSVRVLIDLDNPPEAALFFWRSYEADVERIIDLVLGPGMTALDVGANCGVLTLTMREAIGPTGRVISVDPSPVACQRVNEQLALNGFDNIEVVNAALGAREGVASYFLGRVGIGALPGVDAELTTQRRFPTEILTTDGLVRQFEVERLGLIKIDTDGSECGVLEGARDTLREQRPIIICECYPDGLRRRGRSPHEQGRLLVEAGYHLLRARFARRSRFLARPAAVQLFEPVEVENLPTEGAENILALHADDPRHRRILRQVTTRRGDAVMASTRPSPRER
jgi:FkbM family methyltransferase